MLLAIARVETERGRVRDGQPDDLVPADVRATVHAAALQPGGIAAVLLGLPDRRRIGDWVNPQPVDTEHAMGFMRPLIPRPRHNHYLFERRAEECPGVIRIRVHDMRHTHRSAQDAGGGNRATGEAATPAGGDRNGGNR